MRKITHNPQFFYNPSAEYAYNYARYIIKTRWPEAEPYIMKDPYVAYWYARHVIKDKLLEYAYLMQLSH